MCSPPLLIDTKRPPSGGDACPCLTIDYAERGVSVAGRAVQLTATEYELLFELSANAGRVLTHGHLLQRIWRSEHSDNKGTVRSVVKRLRRKLRDDASNPAYIFDEPRVGYRLAKAETPKRNETWAG